MTAVQSKQSLISGKESSLIRVADFTKIWQFNVVAWFWERFLLALSVKGSCFFRKPWKDCKAQAAVFLYVSNNKRATNENGWINPMYDGRWEQVKDNACRLAGRGFCPPQCDTLTDLRTVAHKIIDKLARKLLKGLGITQEALGSKHLVTSSN